MKLEFNMNQVIYVPILKLKLGEVTAMKNLSEFQKTQTLPVFEVVFSSPKKKALLGSRSDKLESIINKFQDQKLPEFPAWLYDARGEHPFMLDFNQVFIEEVKAHAIEYILSRCSESGQNVTVCINLSDTEGYKKLVYDMVSKYNFGLCIRISRPDLLDLKLLESNLKDILSKSRIGASKVHLLADIKEERDDQKYTMYFDAVQKISSIKEWQSLIFANGSFPESMGGLKAGKEHDLSRTDWIRYNSSIVKAGIVRIPIYSDYSARYPHYDVEAEKHSPSPTIKYTTESNWRIMKGSDYDYGNYFVYSQALVAMGPYYGVDHCYGDKMIKDKSDMSDNYLIKRAKAGGNKVPAKGSGSSEEWISIGVNHHTVVTLDQLSN